MYKGSDVMDDVMITELHRECIHRESHWPIITDN